MPCPHKGLLTQHTTQQQHAKPRHQPSDRDQQARDRLRNKVSKSKAKIKSLACLQLGTKTLQIVHQTFDPNIPVILHLPALTTTTDPDTILTLFVIQESGHCMPTTDYYFMNIQPDPITIPPPPQRKQLGPDSSTHGNQGSNFTTNASTETRQNQSLSFHAS